MGARTGWDINLYNVLFFCRGLHTHTHTDTYTQKYTHTDVFQVHLYPIVPLLCCNNNAFLEPSFAVQLKVDIRQHMRERKRGVDTKGDCIQEKQRREWVQKEGATHKRHILMCAVLIFCWNVLCMPSGMQCGSFTILSLPILWNLEGLRLIFKDFIFHLWFHMNISRCQQS